MGLLPNDPKLVAKMDFQAVPASKRKSPARIKSVPARLYIDKYLEHREAYEFIQKIQQLHGEGTKTIVRALLWYKDQIIAPLEKGESPSENPDLFRARLDFSPVPQENRKSPGRISHISVRLYIDKYLEHREAYQFIQSMQDMHGEGNKTIVRALLYYRDSVINA